jgi:chondroitin AC lyase
LVWSADLAIHYGALTADEALIKKASILIADEIKITTGDGIQPDFSYHQHSARLQTYHYGSSFVKDNIRLAWQLKGTSWQFPPQKIAILTNFILEGWQWMSRGENTVPGTLDRSVSRKDYLKSADLKIFLPYLINLVPTKSASLSAILKAQITNGTSIKGFRFYPYSDFTAYQQQDFSYFLKTISSRTEITEQINGENTKGNFLNFGDSYFIKKGTDYYNLMPMWDWSHLPGITNFIGAKNIDRQIFNGGVSNGSFGFSATHLKSSNEKIVMTTNKFWANYKNAMVCLISDLELNADTGTIFTTLNQARWESKVTINTLGNVIDQGNHHLTNVKWIFHAGFAYYPLAENKINLFLGNRSGAWADINASGSKKITTEKIFMPVVEHSNRANFAYAVVSVANALEAQKLNQHFNWKILSNTKICQAIIFDATVLMATFKEKGTFNLNQMNITVDQPCLVMIEKGRILAADPLQKGETLHLKINDKSYQIKLPKDGSTTYKSR